MIDPIAEAERLRDAWAGSRIVAPPSTDHPDFDLAAAYGVERELVNRRRAAGHAAVGRKVGFANKAIWRALKLNTLVWAHMYDDTVRYADGAGPTMLSLDGRTAPKIEPEVVFKLKTPCSGEGLDAAAVLARTEWLALGFEIVDCPFPEWKFQPADFVAAYGLHAALVVGPPRRIEPAEIPALVDQLPLFTVSLSRNDAPVAEGSGRNSLRSPALCVAELAAAIARDGSAEALTAGELVSTGSLTEAQPIARGERWQAVASGIDLEPVVLRT